MPDTLALSDRVETIPNVMDTLSFDLVWDRILSEAETVCREDSTMKDWLHHRILGQASLESAIICRIADSLSMPDMDSRRLSIILEALIDEQRDAFLAFFCHDILATFERDPACFRFIEPVLYFKGFLSLCVHRFAHQLWHKNRRDLAFLLQSRCSQTINVDIHPAVTMGTGIMLDHASGIVIGETSVIGNHVSILQNVTLGGNGKDRGDRHPKVGCNVLIGAGAKVLGNIKLGNCSRVAAGSVVLKDVPAAKTVAGVPARIVGDAPCSDPSDSMDHRL